MHMQMEHALTAVTASVRDHAVAVLFESFFLSQRRCDHLHVAQPSDVFFGDVGERDDVFARNQENVRGRLWVEIPKSDTKIVLMDQRGGDAARGDLAENAVTHHTNI